MSNNDVIELTALNNDWLSVWHSICDVSYLLPNISTMIFDNQKQLSTISASNKVSVANVVFATRSILFEGYATIDRDFPEDYIKNSTWPLCEPPFLKLAYNALCYATIL